MALTCPFGGRNNFDGHVRSAGDWHEIRIESIGFFPRKDANVRPKSQQIGQGELNVGHRQALPARQLHGQDRQYLKNNRRVSRRRTGHFNQLSFEKFPAPAFFVGKGVKL